MSTILFIEPFYGGSHRDFADGFIRNSRHSIDFQSLPARFWKWRMRGAAYFFAKNVKDPASYDCLFLTDLMSLADLKAFWNGQLPPTILYMHENQLSYPLPEEEKIDYQFGFTDISSCLCADRILFNSKYHIDQFFQDLPPFIRKMPEFKPNWVIEAIRRKSSVLYPGCNFPGPGSPHQRLRGQREGKRPQHGKLPKQNERPLIIWNHRWEFDKRPELFFESLDFADAQGFEFDIALLGENFQSVPKAFLEARKRYGKRILQYGFLPDRREYHSWLEKGDIVVSTSIQENFGISIIEAIRYGCIPLLPNRLSYPELIPSEFHETLLYNKDSELKEKLCVLLRGEYASDIRCLSRMMTAYSWEVRAPIYDKFIDQFLAGTKDLQADVE